MPVYLLHGFRWPRPLIRIHIILQNLDDAAAEWLVAPNTTLAMLKNFNQLYPEAMQHLTRLRFVEQYDPNDTSAEAASQPYAYVADIVHEVKLGVDVDEVRGQGVGNEQWAAMMELRDKLAPEEKVGWYVVVCGDEERWAPPTMNLLREGGHNHNGIRRESEADSAYYGGKQSLDVSAVTSYQAYRRTVQEAVWECSPRPAQESTRDMANGNGVASNNTSGTPASLTPELSTTPPTRAGPQSVNGSVSPVREQSSTPNTEISISPVRRDSNANTNSRGVSPVEVRRALGPLDRVRNQSPAARSVNGNGIVNGHVKPQLPQNPNTNGTPNGQTPTKSRPQSTVGSPQPLSQAQRFAKRLSLQTRPTPSPPPSAPPPAKKPDSDYEEVITISPATTAPVQSYRRSRASLVLIPSQNGNSSHTLDALSVAEGVNPAVYKPTNGDGHHDPNKYRAESNGIMPPVFGQNLSQFDLIANNIENAFVAMR
ncbi:hypothetical protein M409DRAFT_48962 [Zasmidium cellare ATCC 36951]|uniref:Uncharacterized protein n=1 Tax=Zasmidium cellare ATCC 36951 TaxID=1080233 RepID=A0A6A6D3U2_ZASCE|nr:uncharacterized protein M409DRAFT_48962 [Zasmidium cellare ATCC 36951]KAF2174084.1 hypothetical protein M409DRAFT_48962 [Zasmidium cellare ATCC 36951]